MDANSSSRKAVLLVMLVFVLGIALGALGTYVVTRSVQAEGARHHNALALFTRDLNLTQQQQQQIEAILRDVRAQYAAIHEKVDPEYDAARKQGRDRIRAILTPAQRPKFEELMRRMDEARRIRIQQRKRQRH